MRGTQFGLLVLLVAAGCRREALTARETGGGSDTDADTGFDAAVGAIEGTVALPDTTPAEDALVAVDGLAVVTSASGTFTFEEVTVGRHPIRAELGGYLPALSEVEVMPGETVAVALRLGEPTGAEPVVTALSAAPVPVPRGEGAYLLASAIDPDGGPLTWSWSVDPGWAVTDLGGGSGFLEAPDVPGETATVQVTVTDEDGDVGTGELVVSTAPNAVPALTSVTATPPVVRPGEATTLTATAVDPDDDTLTYAWTVPAGWTLSGSGASVTVTAPDGYGVSGEVTVEVTDPWGATVSGAVTVSTADNRPPTIGSVVAVPEVVPRGGETTLTVQASDPDGDDLEVSWTATAGWTLSAPDAPSTSLTAPDAPGAVGTATVTVTDGQGGIATADVVVATRANAAPTITSITASPNPVEPGEAMTVALAVADPEDDGIAVTWSVPTGWSFEDQGLNGVLTAPNARGASEVLSVTVTDTHGATDRADLVVATAPNLAPTIASVTANPTSVAPGGDVEVSVDASDPNGDALTTTWTLPSGWSVVEDQGTFVRVRAGDAEGTATIRVAVSDAYGGAAEGAVTIDVVQPNRPPVVTWPDAPRIRPGERGPIVPEVVDPDGDPLTFTWSVASTAWSVEGTGPVATVTAPLPGPGFEATTALVLVVDDGRAQTTASLPLAVGVDGESCQALADLGKPSGRYWLAPDGDVSRSYPTACEVGPDGRAWTLLYKRSAGVPSADLVADFLGGDLNPYDLELLDRDPEDRDFASPAIVRDWGRFTEAKVEIVDGGVVAQWMTYDTFGVGPDAFFAEERLLSSSWAAMGSQHVGGAEFWSLTGDDRTGRRWYINRRWDGCPNDEGWLIVSDDTEGPCGFDAPNQILYAAGEGVENLAAGNVAQADAMLVWARVAPPGVSRVDTVASCAELPAGQRIGWVDLDGSGDNPPIRVWCEDGWMLAYKKSTGVPVDPYDLWMADDRGAVDLDALTRDASAGDYTTLLTTALWGETSEARVEVLVDGAVAHSLVFDTVGSTNVDWFSLSRLASTTWSDFEGEPINYFSIAGHDRFHRHFFVNRNYGGCPSDAGWLIASGVATACTWERSHTILYSTRGTYTNWNDSGGVGVADALAVWVR